MVKCVLAEYFSSTGYKAEILEKASFDITNMDSRWEEIFYFPIKDDSEGYWQLTECEVEPLFEISFKDDLWYWQTARRLWFKEHFKLLYADEGDGYEDFEDALNAALDAFNNLALEFEVTDLEDIDDSIT